MQVEDGKQTATRPPTRLQGGSWLETRQISTLIRLNALSNGMEWALPRTDGRNGGQENELSASRAMDLGSTIAKDNGLWTNLRHLRVLFWKSASQVWQGCHGFGFGIKF